MAYSDYGGYAYRNGERVVERSDYTIAPDGDNFGTPGSWPGFAMMAAGLSQEEVQKRIQWPHGHAVLGDGPIYVVLYKQSSVRVFKIPDELDVVDLVTGPLHTRSYKDGEGKDRKCLSSAPYIENEEPCVIEVDGWKLTVRFMEEDNFYVYARLEQPDGAIWHGWSGYGVGAGLEDCGYGFSTSERERTLTAFWPDAIK